MVQCHMYCSEQIVVPETLPNILKSYAKAVIRTQPYDLLQWSAAYFRCLAMNIPPPVKLRLERESRFGSLTRGYLRVLLEQVGKGYYIHRDVLEKIWEGLCLPEEELFKYLSLCRMYTWSQIHWLKLFSVMVGSMNDNVKETVKMICDLLTDEPDGGSSPVPSWIFRECFSFIAELDCSEELNFQDGRKILPNGDLEELPSPPSTPKIMSSNIFRETLLEEWRDKLKEIENINSKENESVTSDGKSQSRVSSNIKFVGDFNDPYQIIRKAPDFDSIILLLHEHQGGSLKKSNGPGHISDKDLLTAINREKELSDKKDEQFKNIEEQAEKTLEAERVQMLREIGPPWSWLHQFASSNCREKSYNFLEGQSINSDETPSETSDESFDFDREKFKTPTKEQIKGSDLINWSEIFDKIITAEHNAEISVKETISIVNFIENEEQVNSLDYSRLKSFIIVAEESGLSFKDVNELCEYFEENNLPSNDEEKQEEEEMVEEEEEVSKNIIETTFIESGIEVDDALLKKQISDKMILGVIEKSSDDCLKKTKIIETPSIPDILESDHSNIEITSENSNQTIFSDISSKIDETDIENRLKKKKCKPEREEILIIKNPKNFSCVIQPLPGIGKIITEKRVQDFLTYLKVRSKEQNGMIFPRNFHEDKCPNMIDSNEN